MPKTENTHKNTLLFLGLWQPNLLHKVKRHPDGPPLDVDLHLDPVPGHELPLDDTVGLERVLGGHGDVEAYVRVEGCLRRQDVGGARGRHGQGVLLQAVDDGQVRAVVNFELPNDAMNKLRVLARAERI